MPLLAGLLIYSGLQWLRYPPSARKRIRSSPNFLLIIFVVIRILEFLLSNSGSCSLVVRWLYRSMWLTSTSSLRPRSSAFRLDTPHLAAMTFSLANLRTNLRMIALGLLEVTHGMAPDVQCQCLSVILPRLPKQRKASYRDLLRCFTFGWSLNAARLELNLFWYRPYCFCCMNQVVPVQTRAFPWQKQWSLYQTK